SDLGLLLCVPPDLSVGPQLSGWSIMRTFGYSDFWFILEAAQWTIALSLMAFVGGGIVGLIIALSRTSQNKVALALSMGFIQLFRGTPLLLQLFLVFFGAPVIG